MQNNMTYETFRILTDTIGRLQAELELEKAKYRWRDGAPPESGRYLAKYNVLGSIFVDTCYYAKDLYEVDEFDFETRQGESGWYAWGDDGGSYYEVRDVRGWMPIPGNTEETE